jgi:hypothetical protein
MEINNIKIIDANNITIEKTNLIIAQYLDNTIVFKGRAIIAFKSHIQTECEKITPYFVDLINFYVASKDNSNYEELVKELMVFYNLFVDKFKEVIMDKNNNQIGDMVTKGWAEIFTNLHHEANKALDGIASHLALQLLGEISLAFDKYVTSQKVNIDFKNK